MKKFSVKKFVGIVLIIGVVFLLITAFVNNGFKEKLIHGVYEITSEAPKSVATISTEKYSYSQLDNETKKVYDEILDCVNNMGENVKVSTCDSNVADLAVNAINADYGGLFWVGNYTYKTYQIAGVDTKLVIEPGYTMTKTERDNYQKQIDDVCNMWLQEISNDASDYSKSKWVYEKLINNVDYDSSNPNNQNIISVFIDKKTVCKGYSCAANYLFEKLGIQSVTISGTADGEPHAWNMVKLDNEYYMMDVTWGNTSYLNKSGEKGISYNTLNVTTKELKNHDIDMPLFIPECVAINDNYFYQEGLYFTSFDKETMGKIIHNGYVTKKNVSIKCASKEIYNQMKSYFITNGHFVDYCSGLQRITYVDYSDYNSITFNFE